MDLFSLFKRNKVSSKDTAKERLQLVLIHDRANVSPEFLQMIKSEILEVISRHIEINQDQFDIQLTQTTSEDGKRQVPALVANIPIKKKK
jgi:cell division topological specificity factor MinE